MHLVRGPGDRAGRLPAASADSLLRVQAKIGGGAHRVHTDSKCDCELDGTVRNTVVYIVLSG